MLAEDLREANGKPEQRRMLTTCLSTNEQCPEGPNAELTGCRTTASGFREEFSGSPVEHLVGRLGGSGELRTWMALRTGTRRRNIARTPPGRRPPTRRAGASSELGYQTANAPETGQPTEVQARPDCSPDTAEPRALHPHDPVRWVFQRGRDRKTRPAPRKL